ncbi:E3 ubiquitin-protein ligase RING1-like [Hibiscus syriacus]|uniref:E3 ubiquitin-protein ligase RING1-like n=1 Tax=Hibiscus syriacus TaxID=106335 RepID=A0A6A3CYI5_HIBSY|nr:E3 ubiquitin-protein ligase RING1-like [Hibiscus syriacus]
MDGNEPHWRTNSSFSPPPLRIWDCRLHSNGMSHGSHAAGIHGSSLSSNSTSSRSKIGSEGYINHHHSVSDGALSYSGSPPYTTQLPRWTSPIQRRYANKTTTGSPSFGSPSSLSESGHLDSSGRQSSFPNRNHASKRSYMTKAVYPLVFRNPVSDSEGFCDADLNSIGKLIPNEERFSPFHWHENGSSVDHKFHKTFSELQRSDASPDPSASSRREGFRWSSASSYDLGLDGENFDIAEHVDLDNLRSPIGPAVDHKCGVCGKILWHKSPWSSQRIIRSGDMPTAGILPCSHVFHAECLDQVTPKSQIHDPPCPLCLKTIGPLEESASVSEPLQVALRSLRRSRGAMISEGQEDDEFSNHMKEKLRRNWLRPAPRWNGNGNGNGSSIKNHIKKHFTFKGKASKDIFTSKVFQRIGSSSSSKDGARLQESIS